MEAEHLLITSLLNCVWRGVMGWGLMWCGVVWCGVAWCGGVWCGLVWCGVVWLDDTYLPEQASDAFLGVVEGRVFPDETHQVEDGGQ